MADLEKDLLIKATMDSAQAETAAVTLEEKLAGVASTEGLLTGATKEAADAQALLNQQHVEAQGQLTFLARLHNENTQALIAARSAMAALGAATEVGGKVMVGAITEARNAVAALEVAQDRIRAGGGVVSPAAIAELVAYDALIAKLSGTMEKGASQSKILGAEAAIARGNIGGLARGVASLGGEFASAALPIAAALAVLSFLPDIIDKIDKKTQAWSASLVAMLSGLDDSDVLVKKASESQEKYEARLTAARDRMEEYKQAQIAMAAGLIAQTGDIDKAIVRWQAYEAALHGTTTAYPELEKAAKSMGIHLAETEDGILQKTIVFTKLYEAVLKSEGAGAAKAFADGNKTALNDVITWYEHAGRTVPAELKKIQTEIGLTSKAEVEWAKQRVLAEKFRDEANASQLLFVEILKGTAELGSEGAAVEALKDQILKHIDALTKLKTTNEADEQLRISALAQLRDLADRHSLLTKSLELEEKALEANRKKLVDLSAELAKNGKAYTDSIEKIELHRQKALQAADDTLRAAQASFAGQTAALDAQLRNGEISQAQYNVAFNELQGEEVAIRRKTQEQEDAINEEAQRARDDLTIKDTETKTKLIENINALKSSVEAADKVRQAALGAEKEHVTTLQLEQIRSAEAALAVDKHAESHGKFAKEIKAVSDGLHDQATTRIPAVVGAFGALSSAADTLIPKLERIVQLGSQISVGGASAGGGGTEGGAGGGE